MISVSIQIDEDSDLPLHEQISEAMARCIRAGAARGARLPSVRGLAARIKVSPATVAFAYRTLVARHLVEASPRSGYVVAARFDNSDGKGPLSLEKIEPNLRRLPTAEFGAVLAEIAETDPSSGGYEDYRGNRRLRERLADLDTEAGFSADPDMNIIVTAGAQQAIALCARILGSGRRVAMEDPTYLGARIAFARAGAEIVPVPAGRDGPDLAALEKAADSVDLFYACPTYANPTGRSWSVEVRERVAALAAKKGLVVIEDDFLGDLDYLGERLPRLKALAPEAGIIHVRTFSKCLLPSLRIAGVTADPRTVDLLQKEKTWSDVAGSALLQRALATFLERGGYRAYLERVRPFYRKLREALRKELGRGGAGIVYGDPPAGLCLFSTLPEGVDGSRFVEECRRLGVTVSPGRDYHLDPADGASSFRIGFGGLEPEDAPLLARTLERACERAAIGSERVSIV